MNRNESTWESPQPFLWNALRAHLFIVLYLVVASAGMLGVYWFFTLPAEGADAIATGSESGSLTAAIYKSVPARPVSQRFVQTMGPLRIGIISGHMDHDSGAVCEDGLTEAQVNLFVAQKVVALLQNQGIRAEILAEFDPRLQSYSGTALVSIHADSCEYYNEQATGFKISGSSITDSTPLSTCLEAAYAQATGLAYHANTITDDMRDYHAFRKLAPGVQAVIIEIGFLNLDRELLTARADVPAAGIANGILCFLDDRDLRPETS